MVDIVDVAAPTSTASLSGGGTIEWLTVLHAVGGVIVLGSTSGMIATFGLVINPIHLVTFGGSNI